MELGQATLKEVTYNIRLSLNSSATLAQCQEILDLVAEHKMVKNAKFVMEERK